jgi:DNA-binding MarR family transcriptional regulator
MIAEVSRLVAELQTSVDAFDEAAAESLGLNRTDLRCVSRLYTRGPMTAGELANASGLTAGALTTALDRLEQAGYATRVRDTADRRRVLVELTPLAHRRIGELWDPVGDEGKKELGRYTRDQLLLIRDFLDRSIALQTRHIDRLHKGSADPS